MCLARVYIITFTFLIIYLALPFSNSNFVRTIRTRSVLPKVHERSEGVKRNGFSRGTKTCGTHWKCIQLHGQRAHQDAPRIVAVFSQQPCSLGFWCKQYSQGHAFLYYAVLRLRQCVQSQRKRLKKFLAKKVYSTKGAKSMKKSNL